jgi:hypothetical protein
MSKKIQQKNKKSTPTYVVSDFVLSDTDFGSKSVFLYRFVYSSSVSFLMTVLIMVSFLVQGLQVAYANEEVDSLVTDQLVDSSESEVVDSEILHNDIDQEVNSEQLFAANFTEETADSNSEEFDQASLEAEVEQTNLEETIETDISTLDPVSSVDASMTEEEVSDSVSDEDVVVNDEDILENDSDNSNDENVADEEAEEEVEEGAEIEADNSSTTSTSTLTETEELESELPVNSETISVTTSDSEFSFTKDECTELANGSFYCLKPQANELKDALFAAPDEGGDMEIFFVKDGLQVQVTNNNDEDASPYYDQNTNSIVWHRLIDDRYQIVLYDVAEQKEVILTKNSSNNMEPTRQGDYIVWQRWVDGGWNIILYDGKTESQLTKTTGNNVAPYIHGSLVVWNRHDLEGKKTIEIFNIDSRTYVTVDDPDGLSVSNPRMVFVYDSLAPNGDVVTKGYDVLAKKFIELDTLPRELPEEIPTSDSTGETRALIQSKPSIKSEIEEVTGEAPSLTKGPGIASTTVVSTGSASSTASLTLDLSAATSTNFAQSEVPVEVVISPDTNLAEFDLVIEPLLNANDSALSSTTVQE